MVSFAAEPRFTLEELRCELRVVLQSELANLAADVVGRLRSELPKAKPCCGAPTIVVDSSVPEPPKPQICIPLPSSSQSGALSIVQVIDAEVSGASLDASPLRKSQTLPMKRRESRSHSSRKTSDMEWSWRHMRAANATDNDGDETWKVRPSNSGNGASIVKSPSRVSWGSKPPSAKEFEPPPPAVSRQAWVGNEDEDKAPSEPPDRSNSVIETPKRVRTLRRSKTCAAVQAPICFESYRLGDGDKDDSVLPHAKSSVDKVLIRKSSNLPSSTEALSTSLGERIEGFVYHWTFEYLCICFILLNTICIGFETDYKATNMQEASPVAFEVAELVFFLFFLAEFMARLVVNHVRFLRGPGWQLNIFDCVVLALQILELLITVAVRKTFQVSCHFYVLRLVRLIRLVRIVRTLRVLRLVGEVRTIVWSVALSFKPLCGAIIVLFFMTYLTGIYLSEVVLSYRIQRGPSDEHYSVLGDLFGSVSRCMLTLFEAITGGLDWDIVVKPLVSINPMLGCAFAFYVAFSLLALMNTITGVFVQHALAIGKKDKDSYTVSYLRSLFELMDEDEDGKVSWEDFKASLTRDDMAELFQAIELDKSEAQCVFRLLDIHNTGIIDADEFLHGCLRLRGQAKALDMLVMMRETRTLFSKMSHHMRALRGVLQSMGANCEELWELSSTQSEPSDA